MNAAGRMNTVAAALQNAARALHGHSDSPRLDAELLLGKLLGLSRPGLIARGNEPCASDCEQSYASLIDARRQGVPVAYLTGSREFWSLTLRVTPAVLVPRPETEILVEQALQRLPRDRAAARCSISAPAAARSRSPSRPKGPTSRSPASISQPRRSRSRCRTRANSDSRASTGAWVIGSQRCAGERFD